MLSLALQKFCLPIGQVTVAAALLILLSLQLHCLQHSQYIIIIKLTSASIKDFYFVDEIYCRNLGGEVYE